VEVLISVVILAAAITTLYGLQVANTRTTLKIANENQAVLLARQFFATLDMRPQSLPPLSDISMNGNFKDAYDAIGVPAPPLTEEALGRFRVFLEVGDWSLSGVLPGAMRRMKLKISWGRDSRDFLTLTYFLPPN
jgi:hypothetical protein